jgi:predicted nucleic acid-binding protein
MQFSRRIMNATDQAYMLDTTEFNRLKRGEISFASFADRRLIVTGIQEDELRATKNIETRAALLSVYEKVAPAEILASSFTFDIEGAGFGQAYWNDGSGNFDKMLNRLRVLDPNTKKPANQLRDILIAETAIKNGATLVSGDSNLRTVVAEFGGCAIDRFPV